MPAKLPIKHPAGISGFIFVEDRCLCVEFPDVPKLNQTVDLCDVALDLLAGQLLDVKDEETNHKRLRTGLHKLPG